MEKRRTEVRSSGPIRTQMYFAHLGRLTEQMKHVAGEEGLDEELVRREILAGRMIIPVNVNHPHVRPTGIGIATRCKINANIGNSSMSSNIDEELEKLDAAIECGADAVMDLSTGSGIDEIRTAIIAKSIVPVGTVPIYEAVEMAGDIGEMSVDHLFEVISKHAEQGVDFVTVHCGILERHIPLATSRTMGIVSRGGALLARWMQINKRENPLYEHFDRLLKICQRYDLSLSLGDGLRPGCLADASDNAQFAELEALGELVKRARAAKVQAMVEGPGHIPFDEIAMNVQRQVKICDGAPFYVLGPLVTDIAAGHDHITSAIGGTMAAYAGASMLCYVTPKEHLGLPTVQDVRDGVVAHKIAAHAADIARKRAGARDRDDMLSRARYALDWERQFDLMLDPVKARSIWQQTSGHAREGKSPESRIPLALSGVEGHPESRVCSMCGPKFCAIDISHGISNKK